MFRLSCVHQLNESVLLMGFRQALGLHVTWWRFDCCAATPNWGGQRCHYASTMLIRSVSLGPNHLVDADLTQQRLMCTCSMHAPDHTASVLLEQQWQHVSRTLRLTVTSTHTQATCVVDVLAVSC
jgi:hypothetical protein